MITIARSAAIDGLRASGPSTDDIDDIVTIAARGPTPEQTAIMGSEASRIVHCLGELDTDHAASVRGVYPEGQSYAEMAERYSVPHNAMKTCLRRSVASLKDCPAL